MSDKENYSDGDEDPKLYYQINYVDQKELNENQDQNDENQDQNDEELEQYYNELLTDDIIQYAHKSGLSKEDAFITICVDIANLRTPTKDDAIRWFSGWREENLNPRYLTLIEKINDYYLSKYSPIVTKSRFDGPSKFFPASSRYEIGIKFGKKKRWILFDHYHGQKKAFKLVKKDHPYPKLEDMVNFVVIDPHRILVYDSKTVTILELDYEKGEFWATSKISCSNVTKVLSDNSDVSKFVLFNIEVVDPVDSDRDFNVACFVQFGSISPDGLELNDQKFMLALDHKFICPKFNEDVLTVFEPVLQSDGWELNACDLIGEEFVKKFSFNGTQNVELEGLNKSTPFAWLENECFVLMKNNKQQNCLYSLNILTQNCKMIHSNFPVFERIHFDSDGTLVAEAGYKIAFYHIKSPQKLEQIVWREIRRKSFLCQTYCLYNLAKKQLPDSLKPFSV